LSIKIFPAILSNWRGKTRNHSFLVIRLLDQSLINPLGLPELNYWLALQLFSITSTLCVRRSILSFVATSRPITGRWIIPPVTRYAFIRLLQFTGLGLAVIFPVGLDGASAIAQPVLPAAKLPLLLAQTPATATTLIVNPATGNDSTADGSTNAPFKTITQALQVAQPNTVILLAEGTYGAETGETFPICLKPGVTIQGNPQTRGQNILIQGSGSFLSPSFARQNITVLGENQAALIGVTVINPHPQGYGVWIESTSPVVADSTFTASGHDGISVTGSGAPLIRGNYFYQNGANGITIYGTSRAEVRENVFENTGFAININQKAMPLIVNNRITQNKDGIVVQANAQPILRNNSVEGNVRDGLVAIAQSRPNLGTTTTPGGNFFRNNGQLDINAQGSSQTLPAFGNEISKTSGRLDLTGTLPEDNPDPATTALAPSNSTVAVAPLPSSVTEVPARSLVRVPNYSAQKNIPSSDISAASFPVPQALNPSAETNQLPVQIPIRSASVPRSVPSSPPAIAPSSPPPRQISPVTQPIRASVALASETRRASLPITPQNHAPLALPTPTVTTPIEIPVPMPESRSEPSPVVMPRRPVQAPEASEPPTSRISPGAVASIGVLPVPDPNAPIGNVGAMPEVNVYRNARRQPSTSSPQRAVALGFRYRVVVDANTDSEQARIHALIPNAFRSSFRGRSVMQVGAFSDRDKANELLQSLRMQGFQATLEPLK
jgi:parallel beta-helix repeat protein